MILPIESLCTETDRPGRRGRDSHGAKRKSRGARSVGLGSSIVAAFTLAVFGYLCGDVSAISRFIPKEEPALSRDVGDTARAEW